MILLALILAFSSGILAVCGGGLYLDDDRRWTLTVAAGFVALALISLYTSIAIFLTF